MIVETERLSLSETQTSDAPFILKLLNDPGFIQNIRDEGVTTIKEVEAHIAEKYSKSYQTNGFGMYLVTVKSSGEPVGVCGIVKRDTLDCPDVGYAFLTEFAGLGYASESAKAVMAYGANQLGIKRIVGITSADNKASIKILEKLGLKFDSVIATSDGETLLFVP
ncbi:MAG: ribosomal-protein-alanine N-acetyltransferase [Phenylobacterium sp.]|jgi:ribosomal-protein-alanine N-acetyltransferase